MQELSFGVIGAGYMGRLEARLARQVPGCRLVGVWNRTAQTAADLAGELGCRQFVSIEAMLADGDVSAVIVARPTTRISRRSCRPRRRASISSSRSPWP